MRHRESYTEARSRKKWHQTAARNTAKCIHHHHLTGTGGTTQKKMKKKNAVRMISPRINSREMTLHNNWTRENRRLEKDTLTPQVLSPGRVRDSRHLNGYRESDTVTKTPYVTMQTSPPTFQNSP